MSDPRVLSSTDLTGSFEAISDNLRDLVSAAERLQLGLRIEMLPPGEDEQTWKVEVIGPPVVVPDRPKRTRRTKAEMEAARAAQAAANGHQPAPVG